MKNTNTLTQISFSVPTRLALSALLLALLVATAVALNGQLNQVSPAAPAQIKLGETSVTALDGQSQLKFALRDNKGNCEGKWRIDELDSSNWKPTGLGSKNEWRLVNHGPCDGDVLEEYLRDLQATVPFKFRAMFLQLIKALGL